MSKLIDVIVPATVDEPTTNAVKAAFPAVKLVRVVDARVEDAETEIFTELVVEALEVVAYLVVA